MSGSRVVAKINSLLAEKGISKQEFYSACGITSASYSLWKTGKTQPRMKSLQVISDFLNVPVTTLLGEQEEQKEKPSTKNGERLFSYSDLELLDAIKRADEKDLRAIRVLLGIE